MKKKIIIASIVIVAAVLILTHIPKDIEQTMTVATADGKTAEVVFDLRYYPNLILPSLVRGTVTFDGVEYTDAYTMWDRLPGQIDNSLFENNWVFIRSDSANSDTMSNFHAMSVNQIKVLHADLNNNEICKVLCSYTDESNEVARPDGTTSYSGISYWGPAQNGEEAKKVAESMGYNP